MYKHYNKGLLYLISFNVLSRVLNIDSGIKTKQNKYLLLGLGDEILDTLFFITLDKIILLQMHFFLYNLHLILENQILYCMIKKYIVTAKLFILNYIASIKYHMSIY